MQFSLLGRHSTKKSDRGFPLQTPDGTLSTPCSQIP